MTRREFTKRDKAVMLRRASDHKGRIRCEGCGLDVTGKPIEFDHTIAEALILDKTRPLTPEDGKLLGKHCCHRGEDGKTSQDIAAIAQAKRREAARGGFQKPNKGSGFAPPQRNGRASRPPVKWYGWRET